MTGAVGRILHHSEPFSLQCTTIEINVFLKQE